MKKTLLLATMLASPFFFYSTISAQCYDGFLPDGQRCGGTIQTAVPFVRISADARSGAMGDVGIALTPDANSIQYNASSIAFSQKKWGASADYTPWLRNLGATNVNLFHGAGFYQIGGDKKQAIGLDVRYFSLGNITWTDYNAQPIGEGHPQELMLTASYSRQLNEHWAIGGSAKYIYSDLGTGQVNPTVHAGKAAAVDISATYKKTGEVFNHETHLLVGAAISNVGNKISYLRSSDFLPANLGIGASYEFNFDENNKILLVLEFNKLLVPTPQPRDSTGQWRNVSAIKGIVKSFGDAPGGFQEEIREISNSFGIEYWMMNHFALRLGHFHENITKGGRDYLTVGGGVRYKMFGLNVSYLAPTAGQKGPLDNTLRFSLLLNGAAFGKQKHINVE